MNEDVQGAEASIAGESFTTSDTVKIEVATTSTVVVSTAIAQPAVAVVPPVLGLLDVDAYRAHFEAQYCNGPIVTFDGISVYHSLAGANDIFIAMYNGAGIIQWVKSIGAYCIYIIH